MAQRVIVDSNMLQERALRAYFLGAPDNLVVLPDFLWAEIYKQQSVDPRPFAGAPEVGVSGLRSRR